MNKWSKYPVIYEINTWVWLDDLSRKYRKSVNLATVPTPEWDALAAHGFDAVWFMGVWERSPGWKALSWSTSRHAGKKGSRPQANTVPPTVSKDAGSFRASSTLP